MPHRGIINPCAVITAQLGIIARRISCAPGMPSRASAVHQNMVGLPSKNSEFSPESEYLLKKLEKCQKRSEKCSFNLFSEFRRTLRPLFTTVDARLQYARNAPTVFFFV